MTPAGIEPVAFRFVAQHLDHCATAVPTMRRTGRALLTREMRNAYNIW